MAQPDYTSLVNEIRANFETRKSYPIPYRLGQLANLRRGILEMEKEICEAVNKDLRKPLIEAFIGEIGSTVGELDHSAANLTKWAADESYTAPIQLQPATFKTIKQPKGVTLIIAPWNFPIHLSLAPLIAAISAGCAAIVKPSELAPASSKILVKLIAQYLDQDLYRTVEGDIPETTALLKQRWNHIFYTGNGPVGKIVAHAAAESLCSSTLELGGKSPVFIAPDANVRVAARRITGTKNFNNGQICIAPDFVLCSEAVLDQFLAEVKAHALFSFGTEPEKSKDLARVINARHFDRLMNLLNDDHGGKIVHGGPDKANKQDLYLPFTVILNPRLDSKVMREEIFGPILPVISVKNMDEALSIINGRDSSLASYIYTETTALADRFVKHTNSGGSAVNDCVMHISSPDLPFGGHSGGGSGYGNYHGEAGFRDFTHYRIQYTHSTWLDPNDRYAPYDDSKLGVMHIIFVDGIPQYVKTGAQLLALGAAAYMFRSKF